jgi:hypothetical protein
MNAFSPIATIISMVLGLGVTRMLLGLIAVFRSRQKVRADWLPLAWAAIIFLTQMQYWWAVTHMPSAMADWTFLSFLGLTVFTGLLFICGALLLPQADTVENQSLRSFFEAEGRSALPFLSLFFALSLTVNAIYFDAGVLEPWAMLNIIAAILPLIVYRSASRTVQAVTTLAAIPFYVAILVAAADERLSALIESPFF